MSGEAGAVTGVEGITADWIGSLLGATVDEVDVKPVGEVAGFASDTARVKATLADGSARHLFCKFVLSSGVRGEGMDVPFKHEAAFYKTYAASVLEDGGSTGMLVPTCVHASDSAIVLVDEVAERGGRVGDQLAGCTRAQASMVLRAFARLHARWWRSDALGEPELKAFSAAARFGDPASFPMLAPMLVRGAEAHRTMLAPGADGAEPAVPSDVPAAAFDGLAAMAARGIDLMLAAMPRANTLVHADVRLDNMIFVPAKASGGGEGGGASDAAGDAGERLVMLDWQAYAAGWNVADVVQFILFNLNAEGAKAADVELELLEECVGRAKRRKLSPPRDCVLAAGRTVVPR